MSYNCTFPSLDFFLFLILIWISFFYFTLDFSPRLMGGKKKKVYRYQFGSNGSSGSSVLGKRGQAVWLTNLISPGEQAANTLSYGQPVVYTNTAAVSRPCPIMKREVALDCFVCEQVRKRDRCTWRALCICLPVVKTERKEQSKSSEVVYLSNIQRKNNAALPAA